METPGTPANPTRPTLPTTIKPRSTTPTKRHRRIRADEKPREEIIASAVKRIANAWPTGRPPLALDAADLESEGDADSDEADSDQGVPAIRELIDHLQRSGTSAAPVVRLADPPENFEALRESCSRDGHGALIRVTPNDLDDSVLPLDRLIEARVQDLGIGSPALIDVILDFGAVGGENAVAIASRLGRFLVSDLTRQPWRTVAVAAGAFPSDLSGVQANTFGVLPRLDKELWQNLNRLDVGRPLDFADYAVAHPLLPVGGAFAAPPQLRYTVDDAWLVLKGRRQDRRGHAQFFDICRALVEREGAAFRPDLSWGDNYIWDAAHSVNSPVARPGNATTWRSIATSHHLAWVARSLRERDEP
ncbi:MAG TPA: hypothetical protein DHV14_00395 [Micrococcales bacterium]|uniref:beta family protein n=1 Tax=Miniimonas arenae TaxID=676201 RepID=UPI000EC83587|nr:hypothetical protein [Miniimonas arenae]HCX83610.1 hypothetical protein [Micrococcales bacterium]